MADVHGSPGGAPQMPASDAGPAPVPYGGPDLSPEPPMYGPVATQFGMAGAGVMSGVAGAMGVQESGYAHDMNAGLVTPYVTSAIKPVYAGGDQDAGGRDDVSETVAGAVAAAEARFAEHLSDVTQPGPGVIGDLMAVPANSLDPAVGAQGPEGAFYDPPRNY